MAFGGVVFFFEPYTPYRQEAVLVLWISIQLILHYSSMMCRAVPRLAPNDPVHAPYQ